MDDLGNPDDDEMCEPCGCGHTLGQHAYGNDSAPCDYPWECGCYGFHGPWLHDLPDNPADPRGRCCAIGRAAADARRRTLDA